MIGNCLSLNRNWNQIFFLNFDVVVCWIIDEVQMKMQIKVWPSSRVLRLINFLNFKIQPTFKEMDFLEKEKKTLIKMNID